MTEYESLTQAVTEVCTTLRIADSARGNVLEKLSKQFYTSLELIKVEFQKPNGTAILSNRTEIPQLFFDKLAEGQFWIASASFSNQNITPPREPSSTTTKVTKVVPTQKENLPIELQTPHMFSSVEGHLVPIQVKKCDSKTGTVLVQQHGDTGWIQMKINELAQDCAEALVALDETTNVPLFKFEDLAGFVKSGVDYAKENYSLSQASLCLLVESNDAGTCGFATGHLSELCSGYVHRSTQAKSILLYIFALKLLVLEHQLDSETSNSEQFCFSAWCGYTGPIALVTPNKGPCTGKTTLGAGKASKWEYINQEVKLAPDAYMARMASTAVSDGKKAGITKVEEIKFPKQQGDKEAVKCLKVAYQSCKRRAASDLTSPIAERIANIDEKDFINNTGGIKYMKKRISDTKPAKKKKICSIGLG
mmetsp:Transcript_24067/g.30118  ORF Transcript_24067/g.30118 Transcript_24067/m.30118 type:complete len:421 (+) Transcript_24067:75-1337(+)